MNKLIAESLPGWFSENECRKLYAVTMYTIGDILEIGHFLGRSTSCICEGIRDSGRSRKFTSYDMAFESEAAFTSFFNSVHKKVLEPDALIVEHIFSKGSTSTKEAKNNLRQYELDCFVNLISGDFMTLDNDKYDLIFSDAVHEPNEINLNLPGIIRNSNDKCIWAFHDMNPENVALVLDLSNSVLIEQVDTLGIFMFRS